MRKVLAIGKIAIIAILLNLVMPLRGVAQKIALRNNLLYDVSLTPNLGAEIRLDSVWSAGALVGLNAWDVGSHTNKKWRHLLVSPNVRRYFDLRRDSLTNEIRRAKYFEADLIYSHFNAGNTNIPFGLYKGAKNRRLQGDLIALGGKYGYSWILSRDWRVEAEAGIAVGYAWFKEYDCPHCGTFLGNGDRIFLLPQLGVNVVYIIN